MFRENSMNVLQSIDELERWYEKPDPWHYEANPDDLNRRAMLLSVLPKRAYHSVLDIGCGDGFLTKRLPGKQIVGIDVSANAIKHAQANAAAHISYHQHSLFDLPELGWTQKFDLVVVTGVFYPQYIARSHRLALEIVDEVLAPGGILASVHISEWYPLRFPYVTLVREYYPYREYTHILEVYQK
jgi:trans-aconitate methyltransferase